MPSSILRRKIAASESRRAELRLPVEKMSAAIADMLTNYFMVKLAPPPLMARVIEPKRLASNIGERVWYLFRSGDVQIVVAFDFLLTIAATNMAIGRKFSEFEETRPSLADRAIAAGLAQRSATALSAVKGMPETAPAFVRSCWTFDELKIDRNGLCVEWYDVSDIPLSDSFKVTLSFGVSVNSAQANQPSPSEDDAWRDRLLEIAFETEIQLHAQLGMINTNFGSLMDLAPGMTLPVAAFNRDNIPMAVHGSAIPLLSGKIGGQDGLKAVRIRSTAFW
ncbi:MAG: hypothetical protein A3E78_00470 [Alphaproteobacteria bacterium RIFCSPHIGHO2_12_FULL_63_12]|nr:MAG: hypothetical protein A3E78_00470 [Alphaproteobacteria bacterium RIFCSPHIGHO2_12_FULL_63_12]